MREMGITLGIILEIFEKFLKHNRFRPNVLPDKTWHQK